MTYLTSWEEFAKAAERLYLNDPQKVTLAANLYNIILNMWMYTHWVSRIVYIYISVFELKDSSGQSEINNAFITCIPNLLKLKR